MFAFAPYFKALAINFLLVSFVVGPAKAEKMVGSWLMIPITCPILPPPSSSLAQKSM